MIQSVRTPPPAIPGPSISTRERTAAAFVEINRRLAGLDGLAEIEASQALVDLAVACIGPCRWAAITAWPVGESPRSPALTDHIALQADMIQYALEQGPCLEAAIIGGVVALDDIGAKDHWPAFCAAVLEESPVRSVLSLHLGDRTHRMALNLYADTPHAFSGQDREEAAMFVLHARSLMLHTETASRAANLEMALKSSRDIGTAIGVLMGVHQVTADEALAMLKESSNRSRRKIREVASCVVAGGELPTLP